MSEAFEEVRLRLPHIELAARLYGPPDGMPVIALHGWLDNAASFARLAPRLEGMRIVALDMAGHGLSAQRPAGCHYTLWDYAYDVLQVAEHLGWQRFSLLGHSLGAIVSMLLGASLPERVQRLALIDGLTPGTTTPQEAPAQLAESLNGLLKAGEHRKVVHESFEEAVAIRMLGMHKVSRDAARLLAERGVMAVPGGFSWRADSRLRVASPLRLSAEQATAFIDALRIPVRLIIAMQGLLGGRGELSLLERRDNIRCFELDGGHHLHLDDEQGAQRVADCFKPFLMTA